MTDMQLHDQTLACADCGQEFTFTASEQLSYARRGQGKPSRCAFCRAAGMIAAGAANTASGERSPRTLYVAVCTQCGKQTRVPFEPRGNRPVYCSDCYRRQHEHGNGYDTHRRSGAYHK